MAVFSGTTTVPAAGTRVQSAATGPAKSWLFKARHANVGDCYLGSSAVSSTTGMSLAPGESITINAPSPISSSQFFVDAATNNDKVDFLGIE